MSNNREEILATIFKGGKSAILSQKIGLVNFMIQDLQTYAHTDYVLLSNRLKEVYNKAKALFNSGKLDNVAERGKHFVTNMGKLIIDLQIHDNIRQKLQHIEEVNKRLNRELEQGVTLDGVQSTDYCIIFPEVCLLHKKQFGYLSEEYTISSEMLKGAIEGILNDEEVSDAVGFSIQNTFNHSTDFTNKVLQIQEVLDEISHSYELPDTLNGGIELQLNQIEKLYTMQSERDVFNELFFPEKAEAVEDIDDIELF